MKRLALFLLIALAAMAIPAQARDDDGGYWARQRVRVFHAAPCEWYERCDRYRYVWRWVRHSQAQVRSYERREGVKGNSGPHCWAALSVVGDGSLTADGARGQAEQSWIREVRWRYGASYSDMTHADNIKWRCGRSSVRSIAGVPLQQTCEVIASPCRAKFQEDSEK